MTTSAPFYRVEDPPLVTGAATFTADIDDPLLDRAAHAAFVRSPYAAGRIRSVDGAEARRLPGVLDVLTAADLVGYGAAPFAPPVAGAYAQPLLPAEQVSFAGEPIAAVVAETPALATDALELVNYDIERQPPVLDLDAALEVNAIEETRIVAERRDDLFEEAEVVITVRTWNPRQMPAPIEGRAVAGAWTQDGRLMVWAATQRPHGFRASLAALFGVGEDRIRVVAPAVGGAFGGKVSRTPEEYLVPILAQRLGRAVRWNETRSDYFASATQGRGERIDFTLAGRRDGRFTALRADLVKDGGAYPLVGVLLPAAYTRANASGCYDIAHVEFNSVGVRTSRPPTSAFRGAGRSPYIAGLERAVDVFAGEIGLDPAEVRRRNLIRSEQLPLTTPTGGTYDEADYPGDLARALHAAGYDRLRSEQAHRRAAGDRWAMGIGIGCYNHMTVGGGGEEASVTIEQDGTATVVTGSTSQGHGHATTWAQVAAGVLGLPIERIRVVEGDTDRIGSGVGAVGSRSLQTAGVAVYNSATQVLDRARRLAADLLEAAVGDIVVAGEGAGFHVAGTPARAVSWSDVAAVGEGSGRELSCGEFYDSEGRSTFPSGCHVAVVEVDTETGKVTVARLVAVDDAGPRVNPMIVDGQLHGGIAAGVAQVLGEAMVYDDDGNLLTGNFASYAIASIDQFPQFETVVSETASSFNDLGFKGVGESGTVGATPAVHNAVLDALAPMGITHLDLPCTPQRVWEAIRRST